MRLQAIRPRRPGMAALEAVVCAAASMPIAAALYFLCAQAMDFYYFVVGNAVGWPYL